MPTIPSKCGTNGQYHLHLSRGERACEPCRAAHREYQREWAARHPSYRGGPREPKPIPHGTEAGYSAHRRRKIPPCDECRAAHSEYTKARKRQGKDQQSRKANRYHYTYKVSSIHLPLKLFAQLYWTADKTTLAALDEHYGPKRVDDLIKQAEEQ